MVHHLAHNRYHAIKPGHDLLYISSDLSRLDFAGQIPYFDKPEISQNMMIYYIM
jgi:hypothetical protein